MLAYTSFKPYHSNVTILNASVLAHLQSDAFRTQVSAFEQDPRALARLTINLLGHVALEPGVAGNVQSLLPKMDGRYEAVSVQPDTGEVWVCLNFFKLHNFIGGFVLPSDALEVELLRKAIQANFDSKMYKAALMRRRMERLVTRRMNRIGHKASAAYQKAMQAVLDRENPQPGGHWVRPKEDTLERAYAAGNTAKLETLEPLRNRMFARMNAVEAQASHPDYRGSFEEIKTAFAIQYMMADSSANVTLQ